MPYLPAIILICVLVMHAYVALPVLWDRLCQPFWWPVFAIVLCSLVLLLRGARGGFRLLFRVKVDLVISSLGMLLNVLMWSPWLALLGLWLFATAFRHGLRDRTGRVDLTISHWPLLLLAGFPSQYSQSLHDTLLREICDQVFLVNLHAERMLWIENQTLCSGYGKLNPEVVSRSPFAWGGLVALSWLFLMWRRATAIQAFFVWIFVTCCGVLLTAMMVAILFARANGNQSQDITANIMDSCLWLLGGAVCVILVDILVSSLASPIPVDGCDGEGSVTVIVTLWNQWVSGIFPSIGVKEPADNSYGASLQALFGCLGWSTISDACWAWWYSRSCVCLVPLVPLITMLLFVFNLKVSQSHRESIAVSFVETVRERARARQDVEGEEQALRALMSLQPDVSRWQLQLVDVLRNAGRPEDSQKYLKSMISDGEKVDSEARLWLVRDSLLSKPVEVLSDEQRVVHLLKVVEAESGNAEALTLLAEAYVRLGEPALAERAFVRAADVDPHLNLQLLKFYRGLGRPTPERRRFELHLEQLQHGFRKSPLNDDRLAELIRFQMLMGQHTESLHEIQQLRKSHDNEQLRRLEAEVRTSRVRETSHMAFLRVPLMIDDVESSLMLAPDSLDALSLAIAMKIADGAEFDRKVIHHVLEYWCPRESVTTRGWGGQGMA